MGAGGAFLIGEWALAASTMNLGEATETVLRTAAATGSNAAATAPNTFRLTWTHRAGLSKRQTSAQVSIVEQRDGVKVRVEGAAWSPFLAMLHSRLHHEGRPASPDGRVVQSFAPESSTPPGGGWTPPPLVVPQQGFDLDRTVISRRNSPAEANQGPASSMTAVMRFGTGERFDLGAGAVIGRDPQPDPQVPGARRICFDDLSLSRTHLSVGIDAPTVWVLDRHSTNGVAISLNGSAASVCQPGLRCVVPAGAVVSFGDRSFTLEMR